MEMLNDLIAQYIKPELLILIVVLYVLGIVLKRTKKISDTLIPLILAIFGILLSLIWCLGTSSYQTIQEIFVCVFTSITQGILIASVSVFSNQIIKQSRKDD